MTRLPHRSSSWRILPLVAACGLAIGVAGPSLPARAETTREVVHVCDPDTGATTCPFHLFSPASNELVAGEYVVSYITQLHTGKNQSFVDLEVRIRGMGTGDDSGTQYQLRSTTRFRTKSGNDGFRSTFLYELVLHGEGQTPDEKNKVFAKVVIDRDGNVRVNFCEPAGDPLCP